ncbi:MAG: 7-carboxy-7-deazaguanine synthase QueE [Gammaproteobacteria bacterium]|nr:7-carboxy-7-deazaguanine synthase QueE [Gammaproteobacteria bacterium]NBT45141.1 7-carboxy-7-deazaguanine synthase QueE [Gammaproteobacteria bacterium]NBY23045.1 7-carboxy-7-deazaguanine synthase QueE [Gammaproteobacteria bacterium]NDE34054.1 7-carboxy-7-deazaguanine synthase QueE [Gammaproteobacteria bacterium]NDE55775.1 7-carboxy-7-deazaguanine synthase QueE [Gammaproteobacteria bacterium]
MPHSLRITEIFHSLQGESRTVGLPTVFVRLTGCPLRCRWCDTAYAFKGGERMTLEEILDKVASYNTPRVCVTGGEPLAQSDCLILLKRLIERGYEVSLETSGSMDVSEVDAAVIKVIDLKPPGSLEAEANRYENLDALMPADQVKFVIADEIDYEWAKKKLFEYALQERCEVLFSPVAGEMNPQWLAEAILRDGLDVRFQVQLHKLLWGDQKGV